MKIYFTASLTGKTKFEPNYHLVVDTLRKLGHTVIADHIFKHNAVQIRKESVAERLAYFNYLNSWLSECDLLVAETSFPSTSVGFEVATALNRNKSALVLYSDKNGYPPIIVGLEGERLVAEHYEPETLKQTLIDSLSYLKLNQEKRFTMLLPNDLIDYLDDVAKRGRTRSEFIRDLIREKMNTGSGKS